MKVRLGFVSNSSTSSFCIYGTYIEFHEIGTTEFLEFMVDHIDKVETIAQAEEGLEDDRYDVFWEMEKALNLDYHIVEGDDGVYIGDAWSSVGDDETGRQFKDKVEEKIKKLWPKAKCMTLEEAWRDG